MFNVHNGSHISDRSCWNLDRYFTSPVNLCTAVTSAAGCSILITASTSSGPAFRPFIIITWPMNDIARLLNWNLLFSLYFLLCNVLEGSSGFDHGQGQPFRQCPLGQWWVNHLLSYTLPLALQGSGRAVVGNSLVLGRYHMAQSHRHLSQGVWNVISLLDS